MTSWHSAVAICWWRALGALERGSLDCTAQTDVGVTYAAKIEKAEARIDWAKPAADVHNLIRALSPFPGAWFELDAGGKMERVKVLRSKIGDPASASPGTITSDGPQIACGDGNTVQLIEVQRAGKKAVQAYEFVRGARLQIGQRVA